MRHRFQDAAVTAERTIAIIGAGFCGSTLACELLRGAHAPLRVLLIDREHLGRGVAYARRPYPYLLNVPAGRMSASASDPEEFLRFARRERPQASAADFLPREVYGDYLEASLASAEGLRASGVQLERIQGEVIALERPQRSARVQLQLRDGSSVLADAVVLALGNPPPAPLAQAKGLRHSGRYLPDPWVGTPVRSGETVLLVGTGLTMADIVLAAGASTRRAPVFHALSRRGLLPETQTRFTGAASAENGGALLQAASVSMLQLWRTVRALAQELEAKGSDWREAVTLVRTLAPSLWQRLAARERRRFLRHVRAYWDVHRHRLPESSSRALRELRDAGLLQVHAGRLVSLEPAGRRIRAVWQPRAQSGRETLVVDRVINCTGPDYDIGRCTDSLLRNLIGQGIATADALRVGLATDAHGALLNRAGFAAGQIYYLGPLLRSMHWETTAVAELREHAARLGEHLLHPANIHHGRGGSPAQPRPQNLHA